MLVLTIREGESIYIGDDIVVSVIEVEAGNVRIGVEAPRELRISRLDSYESAER